MSSFTMENEMACVRRPGKRSGSSSLVTVILVLLTAVGITSELVEPEAKAAAEETALMAPWDDGPIEELPPAPEGARTYRKFSWEQQYAKRDARGDLVWTPRPFVFEAGESVRYI